MDPLSAPVTPTPSALRSNLGNLLNSPNLSAEEKIIVAYHRIQNYRDNLNEVEDPFLLVPLKFVTGMDLTKILQQWKDYLDRRDNTDYDTVILLSNLFDHTVKTILSSLTKKEESASPPAGADIG